MTAILPQSPLPTYRRTAVVAIEFMPLQSDAHVLEYTFFPTCSAPLLTYLGVYFGCVTTLSFRRKMRSTPTFSSRLSVASILPPLSFTGAMRFIHSRSVERASRSYDDGAARRGRRTPTR